MAGLERGVRPMGDWSMLITLSSSSSPVISLHRPAFSRLRYRRWPRTLYRVSMTSVDFPEPDTPVTQVITPSGIATSTFFRLFSDAPMMRQKLFRLAPLFRHRDGEFSGKVPAGEGGGILHDLRRRPLGHHLAAMHPGPRPHVDDMVRLQDGLLVVLHHQHGIADVAQMLQGLQQPGVVPLVEADGGLVQDIEHPHQAGADLGGQPDPLPLPAGQGAGGAVEREVIEPHIDQEVEPLPDLLQDAPGNLRFLFAEGERLEERQGILDGKGGDIADVPARRP